LTYVVLKKDRGITYLPWRHLSNNCQNGYWAW